MGMTEAFIERELAAARTREADYRNRLMRHRDLARKLRSHAALLRDAIKDPHGAGSVELLLANVARLTSQALEIPRTSIWLFDATGQRLVCRFQLPTPPDGSPEPHIEVASCPGYVRAVTETELGAVAVDDALTDPRTSELHDYLVRNRVGALLDVPLIGPGELRGVLCHEHQGSSRHWQEEEIDFAADVGALVALTLEVERRVRAERNLRGTEAKYQHLVESLPVAVYSFDAKTGALDYLSPRIEDLGGRRAEEYLVSGGVERWVRAVDVEEQAGVRRRLSSQIDDGFEPELVYRIRLPDETRRWVRDTCAIVRDAHGVPVAVQGTLADITPQKEAELRRVELERRFQTLLEGVDVLAVVLDVRGRVEFINDAFLKLTGYTRSEAIGADGFELLLPSRDSTRVRDDFLEGMRLGKVVRHFETTIRRRGGATRKVLWTNTPSHATDGTVMGSSSLGVDITDRLEAEALALQGEKLESLGRLAAGIAHDFNNLLTVIGAAADRLSLPRGDKAEAALDISAAVRQAAELTRALLAYARREPIRPVSLMVDYLVQETLPMLTKLVPAGLRLTHELDAGDVRVLIDPTQLRQIVMNLVGNAVDATRGHGTSIRVSTAVVALAAEQTRAHGLTDEGTFVLLTVTDDGPGIAEDILARIFEPFFTTKARGEGTGLGLAMCAAMVRGAAGFVTAESTPGAGATLRVYLPVVR
jgi:two-component system, cell cycle sensor histidine kinase and response regulator CckA